MNELAIIQWCLKHWKTILGIVLFIGIAGVSSYLTHKHDLAVFEKEKAEAVSYQKAADEMKFDQNKKITEDVSLDYQTTIAALKSRLDDLKRMQHAACVPIKQPAGKANGSTPTTNQSGSTGTDGLRTEWLLDYAGRCESYRLQVIGLQAFINRVWDAQK